MLETFVNANSIKSINFNHEVIAEEDKTNNWEKIDKDHSKDCSEQNGSTVLCDRSDHI